MSPVDSTFAVLAFSSLLAVVNPLSAAPIFLALTSDHTAERRRRAAWKGALTGFAVLMVFALSGGALLGFFGITTQAFRITGGIILFAIGWDMLQARRSRVKATEEEEMEPREDVGVIPLGLPTIAGPGAITTVIVLTAQAEDLTGHLVVHGAIGTVILLTVGAMLVAPLLLHTFGRTGLNVMTRIMGLLVMVVGVQFVLDGLSWN